MGEFLLWVLGLVVWLMMFCRFYAWLMDPDRERHWEGVGDMLGRFFYGKRWDYPLGKSFEERHGYDGSPNA
jgi:hypothetical protein